jgi:hypothetical protein
VVVPAARAERVDQPAPDPLDVADDHRILDQRQLAAHFEEELAAELGFALGTRNAGRREYRGKQRRHQAHSAPPHDRASPRATSAAK